MDLASALQRHTNSSTKNTRASRQFFESGIVIYRNNAWHKLGDDSWQFLESLALSAIDNGRIDIAEGCLDHLTAGFPGSSRVQCLEGILKESRDGPEPALRFYQQVLEADPSNSTIWAREISVLRKLGKIDLAVDQLSKFADTFYTDVEAWLELADIYASQHQYTSALQSLSHVLVLTPQNPFYVLQAGETAYSAQDIPLAMKFFLMAIEMAGDDNDDATPPPPTGITMRAWYGVELSAARLEADPTLATSSPSKTRAPEHLPRLRKLARDVINSAQAGRQDVESEVSSRWLSR
ncbi:TPR-like protein [Russula ochroleuca]|jgi:tetratricopeptide (TPR) repeat protein|uniref:ER membrane protein complex subunit 2 n=1 Tax=Russula ochroleuca TaxID=152965 RepID=A0A9P5JWF6_9AGAM|nr:TPR-like protein [Russula ochroleuca]